MTSVYWSVGDAHTSEYSYVVTTTCFPVATTIRYAPSTSDVAGAFVNGNAVSCLIPSAVESAIPLM